MMCGLYLSVCVCGGGTHAPVCCGCAPVMTLVCFRLYMSTSGMSQILHIYIIQLACGILKSYTIVTIFK